MLNLEILLRDDEIETLYDCISTAAKSYSAIKLQAFKEQDDRKYLEFGEKTTYAWQLFDHFKRAIDRQREEQCLRQSD